jgi:hypothetical protein
MIGVASSEFSSLRDECGSSCAPSRWEGWRTVETTGDVLLVVGGAMVVGATIWWLVGRKSGEPRESTYAGRAELRF